MWIWEMGDCLWDVRYVDMGYRSPSMGFSLGDHLWDRRSSIFSIGDRLWFAFGLVVAALSSLWASSLPLRGTYGVFMVSTGSSEGHPGY